jgi:hypothetical protein
MKQSSGRSSRLGISRIQLITLVVGLIAVGFVVVAVMQSGPKKPIANQLPMKAPEATTPIPDGWVELGGVARPGTDVQLDNKLRTNTKLDELKWPHGYAKPLDPDTNPQVRGVFDALKDRTKPSRFSSFAQAEPFDAAAFEQNPQSYANTIEPSRDLYKLRFGLFRG